MSLVEHYVGRPGLQREPARCVLGGEEHRQGQHRVASILRVLRDEGPTWRAEIMRRVDRIARATPTYRLHSEAFYLPSMLEDVGLVESFETVPMTYQHFRITGLGRRWLGEARLIPLDAKVRR